MGYPFGKKGRWFFFLPRKQIFYPRDAIFDETIFTFEKDLHGFPSVESVDFNNQIYFGESLVGPQDPSSAMVQIEI